jgi:hypothetical protein
MERWRVWRAVAISAAVAAGGLATAACEDLDDWTRVAAAAYTFLALFVAWSFVLLWLRLPAAVRTEVRRTAEQDAADATRDVPDPGA